MLGAIDLDPASCAFAQEVVRATRFFSEGNDGLSQPWTGRLWLNPPYALMTRFVRKLLKEYLAGNVTSAILLANAYLETSWAQQLLREFPVCFPQGRLEFYGPANAPRPATYGTAVFYLGLEIDLFHESFSALGGVLRAYQSPANALTAGPGRAA